MGYEQEKIEYKNHTIVIQNDDDPLNPRTEWDNFTEIHYCSSKYYLGEYSHTNWTEYLEAVAEAQERGDLVFDVYAYIHGGVVLSLGDFCGKIPQGHARFDSGKCGCIIIRKKDVMKNWGKKNWTKALKEKAKEIAKNDIATFNAYLAGEVYEYVIDDYKDSCGGYYNIDDAMQEAKSIVDEIVKEEQKKHSEQLKV